MKCSTDKVVALTALLFTLSAQLYACPSCKENLSANGAGLAQGYNWSIFLMLGVTFTVVGVIAGTLIRAQRKAGKGTSEDLPG